MTNQGALFHTGTANREEPVPVQAKLLARTTDPPTSKRAARRLLERGALRGQQREALAIVRFFGPGIIQNLARSVAGGSDWTEAYTMYMLARRLPELERKGLARVQQDPSKPCRCKPDAKRCRCRDVTREGSRVWEVVA